ncbi:hypothetical protein [Pontiella agarivorans]|uniref:Camelysin metallo-endopeptidase n=1 Tax=Pontiella agarivorans TaxID=3038953 RepID=A0ABU5MWY6_9BACT|nr:hypothetical protein [Pontiella agarivorans]MDZ8118734.1 hypothetical protein [Pontiella agarivorans]
MNKELNTGDSNMSAKQKNSIKNWFFMTVGTAVIGGFVSFAFGLIPTGKSTSNNQQIQGNSNIQAGGNITQNIHLPANSPVQGKIRIVDIVSHQFSSTLDFRIENTGDLPVSISRCYFKILAIKKAPGLCGSQPISEKSHLLINSTVKNGDVLSTALALNLKGHEQDRFTIRAEWIGHSDTSKFIFAVPALKTSQGFVEGKVARFYLNLIHLESAQLSPEPIGGWQTYCDSLHFKYQPGSLDWATEEKNVKNITHGFTPIDD